MKYHADDGYYSFWGRVRLIIAIPFWNVAIWAERLAQKIDPEDFS